MNNLAPTPDLTRAGERGGPLHARRLAGVHGTVLVRDHYWPAQDGTERTGITGAITVHAAADVLGFELNSRDANWLVEIAGDTERIILPGCAVLGFHLHPPGPLTGDYLTVA